MIVADTNLIAYLLIAGERTATAQAVLRADPDWRAPALWQVEFRNVLATAVRAGSMSRETATLTWAATRGLVREHPVEAAAALEVALARGLSAYDAEFAALADALGVRVVTADQCFRAACPDLAVSLEEVAGA